LADECLEDKTIDSDEDSASLPPQMARKQAISLKTRTDVAAVKAEGLKRKVPADIKEERK
jgi:hypothetical protein